MFPNFYLCLLAIVITVLVILIWRYAREGPSIEKCISQSVGVYDRHAQLALGELRRLPNPAPRQRIQRARLIRFNILDNNPAHPMMQEARRDIHAAVVNGADALDMDLIDVEMNLIMEQIFGLNMNKARSDAAANRAEEIRTQAPTRAAAVEQALAVPVADDSQNVHEPKVTQHGRDTYALITLPNGCDKGEWLASLQTWVDNHKRREDMRPCVDMMLQGGPISTYGCNEDDILIATWRRIHDPRNEENKSNLKEALADALADASQPTLVCANGRCARVLASLALLDFDPRAGSAMTLSAYKADIMRECSEEFDRALEASKDTQPAVYASYHGGADPPQNEQAKFHDELREIITRAIDKHREHLTLEEQKQIRAECEIYMAL